jgi:WD40 repeat protein
VKWLTTDQIAIIDEHHLNLYDLNFQLLSQFELVAADDPPTRIREAQWSLDEQRLALLVDYTTRREIQVWDIPTRQRLVAVRSDTSDSFDLRAFALSPDAQTIAISGVRDADALEMVRFLDLNTGTWQTDIPLDGGDPTFMWWQYPDHILLSRYDLELWGLNPPTLERTIGLTGGEEAYYSPSGDRIAYKSMKLTNHRRGQIIEIRDATTFELLQTLTHTNFVTSFRWQSGGIVSADADSMVSVWDPDTGQLRARFETGRLTSVELSLDGTQILTLDLDLDNVQRRDAISGTIMATLDSNTGFITITPSSTRTLTPTPP